LFEGHHEFWRLVWCAGQAVFAAQVLSAFAQEQSSPMNKAEELPVAIMGGIEPNPLVALVAPALDAGRSLHEA